MVYFYQTRLFKNFINDARLLLQRWHKEKKKYLIYGAGIHSKELLKQVKTKSPLFLGFIDQSTAKQKKGFLDFPVYPVENAVKSKTGGVLISSYEHQDRMKSRILELKGNKIEIGALYPPKTTKDSFNSIFKNTAFKTKPKLSKSKARKIAVVDTFFSWPPIGGSSVDLASIMNRLSKKGFAVTFFLPVVEGDLYFPRGRIGNSKEINFDIVNIPFSFASFNRLNFIKKMTRAVTDYDPEYLFLGDIYAFKPYLAESLKEYKTIWRSYAYDLICPRFNLLDGKGRVCHSSFLTDPERCKLCVKKDKGINREHPVSREMRMANLFSKKYHELLIKNIERATHIIVYNEILKKRLKARFPHLKRIKVIPSGIEIKRFNKKKKTKTTDVTILFPGRIDDPAKGFEFFLQVFRRMRKEHPQVRLLITGKTNFGEDGIEATGWIPYSKMPDIYHRADICVIPSLWEEPFGIAALEAMAAGLPVIANAVGGLKQIIQNKKTGFLISPGDYNTFYKSLKQTVENKKLRKELGKQGKSRVKEFSWNKVMDKYKAIFPI